MPKLQPFIAVLSIKEQQTIMSRLLERGALFDRFYSRVSIMANPFFESYGFKVVKPNRVTIQGVDLANVIMERMLN